MAQAPARDIQARRCFFSGGHFGAVKRSISAWVVRSALAHEAPEARLVEQRDLVPLLAQPLDFHQLQARIPAGGLQRIGPPANNDSRPY